MSGNQSEGNGRQQKNIQQRKKDLRKRKIVSTGINTLKAHRNLRKPVLFCELGVISVRNMMSGEEARVMSWGLCAL